MDTETVLDLVKDTVDERCRAWRDLDTANPRNTAMMILGVLAIASLLMVVKSLRGSAKVIVLPVWDEQNDKPSPQDSIHRIAHGLKDARIEHPGRNTADLVEAAEYLLSSKTLNGAAPPAPAAGAATAPDPVT